MKCQNCGYENQEGAKFCKKCGSTLVYNQSSSPMVSKSDNNFKIVIICLTIILIVGIVMATLLVSGVFENGASEPATVNSSTSAVSSQSSSSSSSSSGEWVLIGSYSGSGSQSQSFNVPAGNIRIDITAYPIKNYATNYLHLTGSNGASASVSWGSSSAVESRSDSVSYTSSSPVSFNIDAYETVSWSVKVYRYQ